MKFERDHSGFTLIELLVTIGIIALLIGIALPALSGARQRARDAVGLSNLRQTGVAMENYVTRYNGWMPFASEGTAFLTAPPFSEGAGAISGDHWQLTSYWSSLFFEVAPWEEWFGMWAFPDPRRPDDKPWEGTPGFDGPFYPGRSSLEYARSLFARPEIWESGGVIEDRDSVLRGVRHSEVRYPSAKVSLFDRELCVRVRCDDPMAVKRTMLFVDGHAAMKALSDAHPPVKGRLPELAAYGALAVHDTAGGAHGRDY
ncbi:MAG: prepilin-type N-terminal cleavage/methylation domain-containing protein [Phycisphaerales bacterium]|nr:prepilin-type N-terminal cleavage/methylation domain-containing protein [Phycisphaerales bacterium]